VLVVEADPDLQAQMARVLRKAGHRVVATGSGSGALALMAEWDVSLILVSETLPGRSGIDLVREIHRLRPAARVVMVTSDLEPRFAASARAAGALDCVLKPLSPESVAPFLADPFDLGAADLAPPRLPGRPPRPLVRPLPSTALPARGAVAE
jgi:DNA-binding response OmpR family regulator